MLKSKENNLPEKDGSKRSVKEYAGGGKTGYSMIGMERPVMEMGRPMMMYGGKMKKYKDGVDSDGEDIWKEKEVIAPQGIDYGALVPVLIKAVQELSAKVEALENK